MRPSGDPLRDLAWPLDDLVWCSDYRPTAREHLAREILESHRDAERIARRRRMLRKARRRERLLPWLIALVVIGLIVIGLWGTTPAMP